MEDVCPGPGKCHGCASWCGHCGDVRTICDSAGCRVHHCVACGLSLTEKDRDFNEDWFGWCPSCWVSLAMDVAVHRDRDELEAAAEAIAELKAAGIEV